jgi:putative oxidoreductase
LASDGTRLAKPPSGLGKEVPVSFLYRNGWTTGQSLGLLVLRLVAGAAFILHGWPKIQHPTGWMGDSGAHPILQLASALAEFGGGIALIVGFLTPLAAAAIAVNMVFALFLVHFPKHQPFVGGGPGGSFELPLLYFAVMVALFATGPGLYSLDAALFGKHEVAVRQVDVPRQSTAA